MSTVLVIDDEIGILQIIRQALTKFGHNVETAADIAMIMEGLGYGRNPQI